jgi:hypothetical protein
MTSGGDGSSNRRPRISRSRQRLHSRSGPSACRRSRTLCPGGDRTRGRPDQSPRSRRMGGEGSTRVAVEFVRVGVGLSASARGRCIGRGWPGSARVGTRNGRRDSSCGVVPWCVDARRTPKAASSFHIARISSQREPYMATRTYVRIEQTLKVGLRTSRLGLRAGVV